MLCTAVRAASFPAASSRQRKMQTGVVHAFDVQRLTALAARAAAERRNRQLSLKAFRSGVACDRSRTVSPDRDLRSLHRQRLGHPAQLLLPRSCSVLSSDRPARCGGPVAEAQRRWVHLLLRVLLSRSRCIDRPPRRSACSCPCFAEGARELFEEAAKRVLGITQDTRGEESLSFAARREPALRWTITHSMRHRHRAQV